MNCVAACARNGTTFPIHLSSASRQHYDPSRRQVLAAAGAAIAGIALMRSDVAAFRTHPFRLRPPGTNEDQFLSQCLRCAECSRACPTAAIQPSLYEAGIEGMWTPVLVPRLGYCDYSCNACGQVCPTQAIPALSLEQKRQQVVGQAVIDRNRCIPWVDATVCIVCEEMCPTPEKAIRLEQVQVQKEDGETVTVQRPYVVRDLCIGCGICEYKCPLEGVAAIRVYVPSVLSPSLPMT